MRKSQYPHINNGLYLLRKQLKNWIFYKKRLLLFFCGSFFEFTYNIKIRFNSEVIVKYQNLDDPEIMNLSESRTLVKVLN